VKSLAILLSLVLFGLSDEALGATTAGAPICQDPNPAIVGNRQGTNLILDWQDTVCLEHIDRVARIIRLISELNLNERPTFSQYLMNRVLLPSHFRADIPLLRIVFPERSFFDTARSEIRPEARNVLLLMAAALRREIPDVAVFIVGHTDNRGGDEYNRLLSIARANSVASELNRIGVGEVALWRIGFGEAVPLVPNDSPENMAINRRVEFIIGARTEAVATWLARQCPEPIDAGAVQCRRAAPRHEFEAINVTPRSGLSVQPHAPAPHRLPPLRGRGQALPAPANPQLRIGEVGRPRIVIDLQVRQYRIPALNPL
jgi:hypothetical protein